MVAVMPGAASTMRVRLLPKVLWEEQGLPVKEMEELSDKSETMKTFLYTIQKEAPDYK